MSPQDHNLRRQYCINFQARLEEDGFVDEMIFSDEATFHVSGNVNRHTVKIWGSEHPRPRMEHVRDSPKVNVFCAVSCTKVYGPFFVEQTVTGPVYLDMLDQWPMQ